MLADCSRLGLFGGVAAESVGPNAEPVSSEGGERTYGDVLEG